MSHSIGIIGGADGPTAIFVTGNPLPGLIGTTMAVLLIALVVYFVKKKRK